MNASNNFRLWGELVDLGVEMSLQMIKRQQPHLSAINILKKAIETQSEAHHKANITIFQRLKYAQSGRNKNAK